MAAVFIEDSRLADSVTRASCDLLRGSSRRRWTDWHVVDLVSRRSAKSSMANVDLLLEDGDDEVRIIFIIDDTTRLSAISWKLFDGRARLGVPDWAVVRSVFLSVMRHAPAIPLPPELLSVIPLAAYGSTIRPGAGCNRASARLRDIGELILAERSTVAKSSVEGPRLEEMHGLGEAGRWGRELAQDLNEYRAGRLLWRDVDRGVLLSGPVGSGKTSFARALGRTCNVPVQVHSLASWQAAGYLNDVLKAMHEAFGLAKATAPCVLFIDEIDSFGDRAKLKGHNAPYGRQVINALLECLDGADGREGVIVVGATNHPEVVDAGLKRPGRLDRHIAIPLPDQAARIGILRFHLDGDLAEDDLTLVADRLEGASGAALEQIVRDGRRSARSAGRPMVIADLEIDPRTRIRLSDAAFERVCVHEAGHLVVGIILEAETGSRPVEAVARRELVCRTDGCTYFDWDSGFDRTLASVLAEATVLLSGIAAERIVLGSAGFAAGGARQSDLAKATSMLANAELCHGLGNRLAYSGPLTDIDLSISLQRDAGLRKHLDSQLEMCLQRAMTILASERNALELTATRLSQCGRATASEARDVLRRTTP